MNGEDSFRETGRRPDANSFILEYAQQDISARIRVKQKKEIPRLPAPSWLLRWKRRFGVAPPAWRRDRERFPGCNAAKKDSPNPLELIEAGKICLVINTPGRTGRHTDEGKIRAAAAMHRVPILTTITAARAAVAAIGALKRKSWDVYALQDWWG